MQYRLFGVGVEADISLNLPPTPISGAPDLVVVRGPGLVYSGEPVSSPALDISLEAPGGPTRFQLFATERADLLRVHSTADFEIARDRITYWHRPDATAAQVAEWIITTVITLWLERRGWPVMHAAAIELHGSAVILVAASGTGKSTLAAAFAREGFRTLGDELVPIERAGTAFLARTSYPRVNLYPTGPGTPDLLPRLREAPLLHAGFEKRAVPLAPAAFCPTSLPIRAVYTLDRVRDATQWFEPALQRLSLAAAMIECVRHTFAPRVVQAARLQVGRLAFFEELLKSVPLTRVSYASSLEHLPVLVARLAAADSAVGI